MPSEQRFSEKTNPMNLLDKEGCLIEEGWARAPLWSYDRKLVSSPTYLKEWNRTIVFGPEGSWVIIASIGNNAKRTTYYISYADLSTGKFIHRKFSRLTTKARRLPSVTDENCEVGFSNEDMRIAYIRRGNSGNLLLSIPHIEVPDFGSGLDARFEFQSNEGDDIYTSAIALSKSRRSFLLSEVFPCIRTKGVLRRGEHTEMLSDQAVMTVLDWGRGRFSKRHLGKALFCGRTDQGPMSINIVHRSECAVTLNGKTHILGEIELAKENDGWRITTKDSKTEFLFKAFIDRNDSSTFFSESIYSNLTIGKADGRIDLGDEGIVSFNGIPGIVNQLFS